MTTIDLSRFQTLKEGTYSNAILNEIVLEFEQDHPDVPKWLDTKFTIAGHQIRDRFFVDGDDRLGKLVESIKGVQGDLQLTSEIWSNMPCSVRLTHEAINERKFWHTHDWKWDVQTYQRRTQELTTDGASPSTGQKSLLAEMKTQSEAPSTHDDIPFGGVFDKDGVR
ncbi:MULTISPECIES: hypothetical protein [Lactiplantibacillus]|jgi:hypothetical protein|uniref:hypothetical protein n=1 Tax=Lactiplantibacillus TaxID=2767842 RepID=UPI0006C4555B|nr:MULTISPECIES: hypothetical protein [Lactiplantibacillus]GEK64610.1 hypothetical protein LJA01_25130 [Lactobacillus japonicus]AUS72281.1 hypothetical protein C1T23_01589 [Lactiplantibacillus plantarum]KON40083.1 hypothetical protein ADS73_06675 [Lactiplantibacillus plantarum]KTF01883.1 hypothetical protein SF2A35B_1463 [Lactiplantibacillus plantarum]KZT80711.1 hypothetical protein Nizo1839_1479 [Lactiplantibacillus plantarum]